MNDKKLNPVEFSSIFHGKEIEMAKFFIDMVGMFNHYSFFTQQMWRKARGFKHRDEAMVKAAFMHAWLHERYGHHTCPVGCSWCEEVSPESYEEYMKEYRPVFEKYSKWCEEQR